MTRISNLKLRVLILQVAKRQGFTIPRGMSAIRRNNPSYIRNKNRTHSFETLSTLPTGIELAIDIYVETTVE